jgi:hypothetical protein
MDDDFKRVFSYMTDLGEGLFHPPSIVTMTITCKLNVPFNLDDVKTKCKKYMRPARNGRVPFQNSVTLDFNRKAMKVFRNGTLHLTGCESLAAAREYTQVFLDTMGLEVEFDGDGDDDDDDGVAPMPVLPMKVLTMNVCVRTDISGSCKGNDNDNDNDNATTAANTTITPKPTPIPPLHELQTRFARIPDVLTKYHPDIYQGLVLKVKVNMRQVTALIFHTGTIMFMGVQTPEELNNAATVVYTELLAL